MIGAVLACRKVQYTYHYYFQLELLPQEIDSKSKIMPSNSHVLKCIFLLEGPFDVPTWEMKVPMIPCKMSCPFGVSLSSPANLWALQIWVHSGRILAQGSATSEVE